MRQTPVSNSKHMPPTSTRFVVSFGNPFFYSGRAAEEANSAEAGSTAYQSHEPAFGLWQEWREIAQQITRIRKQLLDAGIESA